MDFVETIRDAITTTNAYVHEEGGLHIHLELTDIAKLSYAQGIMDALSDEMAEGTVTDEDVICQSKLFLDELMEDGDETPE